MAPDASELNAFVAAAGPLVLVEIAGTAGSTPRESGTWMVVSADGSCGTIGGGRLEYMAIAHARELLAGATQATSLDMSLGPAIGQCCGGRVELSFCRLGPDDRARLLARCEADQAGWPTVLIFGGGHVGRALAQALRLLPLKVAAVETRPEEFEKLPGGIARHLTPIPESLVQAAPPGSAFIILTHDHGLDFLLAAEALRRDDAAYVGMIGSRTKKATFASWLRKNAPDAEAALPRLVCPIGVGSIRDKRPEIIAALVAAEVVLALAA